MALWGKTYDTDETKPKWLSDEQKKNTFADLRGWVYRNPTSGREEVLCAIRGLAGTSATTGLRAADITDIEFVTTSFSEAAGGNIDIRVIYNEKVTVDTSGGTPTITVTNDQSGSGTDATFTAAYQSGSSTSRIVFRATYGAADGGVAENDVLSVAAQNIALNSGTIVDASAVATKVAVPANSASLTASA
jgi:hypothetical protein